MMSAMMATFLIVTISARDETRPPISFICSTISVFMVGGFTAGMTSVCCLSSGSSVCSILTICLLLQTVHGVLDDLEELVINMEPLFVDHEPFVNVTILHPSRCCNPITHHLYKVNEGHAINTSLTKVLRMMSIDLIVMLDSRLDLPQ